MQADLTQDANKVFMWLRSREIGTQLALFWVTWSYILETRDSYGAAAKKLVKGVARWDFLFELSNTANIVAFRHIFNI